MSHLYPLQGLIKNLKGEIASSRREFLSPERAYQLLKQWTGQDFGYNASEWQNWIKKNRSQIYRRIKRRPIA